MKSFVRTLQRGLRTVISAAMVMGIALAPLSAHALDGELSNSNTGADSANTNMVDGTRTINFTVVNDGTVTNDFDVDLNTGGNTISNNTTVGDIETGDIVFEAAVESVVNEGATEIELGEAFESSSIRSSNSNTGAGSTNDNAVTITDTQNTTVTNTGSVANTFALNVNTGGNTIERNTTVGDIRTGSITVAVNVENRVNAPEEPAPSPAPTPVTPPAGGGSITPVTPGGQGGQADIMPPKIAKADAVKQLTAKRDAFFPAGASLSVLQLLVLAFVAAVIVYAPELLRALTPRTIGLHRFAAVLPLL